MNPEKILFMGISTHLGGAERSLLDFVTYYKQQTDHKPFAVLLPKSEGPLPNKLRKLNIEVHSLSMPKSFYKASRESFLSSSVKSLLATPQILLYLYRLSRFIKLNQVTVIHSTGLKCHIILALFSATYKGKIVLHFRDILRSPLVKTLFNTYRFKKNISWVSNSKATAKSLSPVDSQVIYNGIDSHIFFPKRNTFLKDQFNLDKDSLLVGHIGVLARWKGQREFILSIPKVLEHIDNCHFFIIGDQIYDTSGDENYYQELKTLADKLNLNKNLHFLGFSDRPQVLLNSLDLCVHSSIRPEPFGRIIVESMLCKTPILAAKAGGVMEIIEDNQTGFLSTPGDVEQLSSAIRTTLTNKNIKEVSEKALQKALTNYSLKKNAQQLRRILEDQT